MAPPRISDEQLTNNWYRKNGWQKSWVKDRRGNSLAIWFPPVAPEARKIKRLQSSIRETPHVWLSMLTAWYHLRDRGVPLEPTEGFSLDRFLDRFFADWGRAASILQVMATMDQSAVMQHFEVEKLHAGTRNAIDRARADYLARQAQREPDPIAQD